MNECGRASGAEERAALKTATKMSLSKSGGGAISPFTRKSQAQLYRYGSKTDPDFAPVDVALEMDRMAEQPIITAQLAASLGYRLVPVGAERPSDNLRSLLSRFIRETGDVSTTIIDAEADGEISPREADDIRKEVREVEQLLTLIRRTLDGTSRGSAQ